MVQEVIKPWGRYVDHYRDSKCVQKTIYVNPKHKLSYQYHSYRGEFWYIEKGLARITINGVTVEVHPGFTIHIDAGVKHRLENVGDEELIVHEMQHGLCSEEDIFRIEDDYKRVTQS